MKRNQNYESRDRKKLRAMKHYLMRNCMLQWLLVPLALFFSATLSAERDMETGVFLSRDPAGFVDGPNLYAYVNQNPWTKFDPEGLESVSPIGTSTDWEGYREDAGHAWLNGGNADQATAAVIRHTGWQPGYGPRPGTSGRPVVDNGIDGRQAIGSQPTRDGAMFAAIQEGLRKMAQAPLPPASTFNPGASAKRDAKNSQGIADEVVIESGSPSAVPPLAEPYNRLKHYGKTPTTTDRKALDAKKGQVVDHDPPLVKRYYEGDPATGEKPGKSMTPEERKASGNDRTRMQLQSEEESRKQGADMSRYSREQKKKQSK